MVSTQIAILSIVFGLGMGVRFVLRQAHLESPLIDMSLFRIRRLNAALVTNLLGIFIAFGYFLFVAQYLQLVLGLTPLEAGLWSLPSAAGFIIGSNVSPHFVHRFRPSLVLGTSLAAASGGLLVLTQVGTEQGIGLVVVGSVLISLALSPVFTLTTELVVGSAPPEKAGAASGISETGAELGGALGIAILGSIGAVVYRSGLDTLPAGLPSQAARAVRETLGAAVAVSQDLPETLGDSGARNGAPGLRPGTAGDGGGECGYRARVGHPRCHAAAGGACPRRTRRRRGAVAVAGISRWSTLPRSSLWRCGHGNARRRRSWLPQPSARRR